MRHFILAVATVAALAGAGMLVGSRAEAMPLVNANPLSGSATSPVEKVYVQCTRFWNGWRWIRRCVEAGPPAYYGPGAGAYGPGYGYYGWRRPRYYGYY
jgi:hypothetical protein